MSAIPIVVTKFPLGRTCATPGALEAFARTGEHIAAYIQRHASCDWGEVCDADKRENDLSLKEGYRLVSAYSLTDKTKIWIITEADRSVTTVLLPNEY